MGSDGHRAHRAHRVGGLSALEIILQMLRRIVRSCLLFHIYFFLYLFHVPKALNGKVRLMWQEKFMR